MRSALRLSALILILSSFLVFFPTLSLADDAGTSPGANGSCPSNRCNDGSGTQQACKLTGSEGSYNECCATGKSRSVIRSRGADGSCSYSGGVGDCTQTDAACDNYGSGNTGGSDTCTGDELTLDDGHGCKQTGGNQVTKCFQGYQKSSDGTDCIVPASSGDSSVQSTTPCDPSSPNGCILDSTNFKAPQNANYGALMIMHAGLCVVGGESKVGNCTDLVADGNGTATAYVFNRKTPGGAIGGLTNTMVAMVDNPPASTGEYLASIGQDLGIVSPAYAQVTGSGANIISPIESVWEMTRNIAYLGFIVIFLVIGFMIMFRQKINPQTVISVQAALPSLIIGIILVTFSYFIASVIIDSAFVGVQVVGSIFTQMQTADTKNVFDIPSMTQNSNVFTLFTSSFRVPENIKDVFTGTAATLGSTKITGGLTAAGVIAGIVGAIITFGTGGIGGIIGIPLMTGAAAGLAAPTVLSLLVPLVLVIALVIQFFRLLIKLIMAYVTLIAMTVLGPLIILTSSIPGRGKGIENWWKALLANSLIFPAVIAMFLFAGLILGTNFATGPGGVTSAPPLFGGLSTALLRLIVAYGVILATPQIPDIVKGAFGVKDIPIGTAAIAGAAAGFGGAKLTGRTLFKNQIDSANVARETYLKNQVSGIKSLNTRQRIYGTIGSILK